MSDNRDPNERPTPEQQPVQSVKLEQIRTIPGGALVRTLPPQQRFIMTPMAGSAALISSTATIQAQVLPKVTLQGGNSNTARINAIPMQTVSSSAGTFHVPKGPAAVANISVPRASNVATPIVRGASLQTITVAPHSIPGIGSSTSGSATMQIGRPVVSNVAPWVGISSSASGHGNVQARHPTTAHLRPTSIQQITDFPLSNISSSSSSSPPSSSSPSSCSSSWSSSSSPQDSESSIESEESSDLSDDDLGSKIGSQIRPLDNQRMLVHSSTTHKQVVTQQAQLSGGGGVGDMHGTTKIGGGTGATVLKSYGGAVGATATARLVASSPANAANLSRIATIPSAAMAVSIHTAGAGAATAVLVPASASGPHSGSGSGQGLSAKTSAAVAMVTMTSSAVQHQISRSVAAAQQSSVHHGSASGTTIQFPGSGGPPTAAALALNTVQVSRGCGGPGKAPALVTVMLSPSVATGGSGSTTGGQTVGLGVATHMKPHLGGNVTSATPTNVVPPQLVQTSSAGSTNLSGQTGIGANQPVFIQTGGTLTSQKAQQLPAALIVREPARSTKDESSVSVGGGGVTIHSGTVYSLPGGSYAYDGQGYLKVQQLHQHQVTSGSGNSQQQPPTLLPVRQATAVPTSSSSHPGTLRINHPMLVVSQQQQHQQQFASTVDSSTSTNSSNIISDGGASIGVLAIKQTTSPRPSILRKREPDSSASPLKVMKNLTPIMSSLSVVSVSSASSPPSMVIAPQSQSPPPKRPESGQSVQSASSSGSTTISANSSPGESPTIAIAVKQEEDSSSIVLPPVRVQAVTPNSSVPLASSQSSAEVSPRKKPRKQQLSGNPIANEPAFSDDEMEFITEEKIKKEMKEEPVDEAEKSAPKRTMSMLSAYKSSWKGRNNHFLRYTDVKPKDDKKPAFSELSNQKNVNQRLNGWKLYHIVTGLEDANQDNDMYNEYDTTLCLLDNNLPKNHGVDKEHIHRLSERVKANYQRSRVTEDLKGEIEANIFTLLEHKSDVADIIHRNTVKRPLKKRERL